MALKEDFGEMEHGILELERQQVALKEQRDAAYQNICEMDKLLCLTISSLSLKQLHLLLGTSSLFSTFSNLFITVSLSFSINFCGS